MELCSTTQSVSIHPKIPYHFRPKTTLTLQKTLISPARRRRFSGTLGIRATISEEPNQYVKENRTGSVAMEDSPVLPQIETEEAAAQVNYEFLDNFNIKQSGCYDEYEKVMRALMNFIPERLPEQHMFDPEEAYSVLFYASGALIVSWLTAAVVGAIDSIPLFPKLMEMVGLGYTAWFTARYLLFKRNRDEFAAEVAEFKKQVLGSDDD